MSTIHKIPQNNITEIPFQSSKTYPDPFKDDRLLHHHAIRSEGSPAA